MMEVGLQALAQEHMRKLCLDIPSRRVGSTGNRAATDYFASVVAAAGFDVGAEAFDCIDWETDGVDLAVGSEGVQAKASPYSLGCDVAAPLTVASTAAELQDTDVAGTVLLLRGDLTREQLMPKRFPFYNPEHHQALIRLLEDKAPSAIVTATSRDPVMVGSQYPFPVFEDGDFNIPSVYTTDEEGARLAARVGDEVRLSSRAWRIPATSVQLTARKGSSQTGRLVLFAHIDSRLGTPGANDNASGTATLLLLAELLSDFSGELGVEIVPINGEDYYAASGEVLYVAANEGRFDEIVLGVNLDDVGYQEGRNAYSLYGCPAELGAAVRGALRPHPGLVEGDAWYQGDHMLFVMNEAPALAVTSELVDELMRTITHTPQDTLDTVDPGKLVTLALALRDLLLKLAVQPLPL